MTELTISTVPAPEPTPAAIDEDHLGRMTLGDRGLEREVLEIFARQIMLTLKRIVTAKPAGAAAAAHTLKGSARGVGAWAVARAAERLEQVAAHDADNHAMSVAIAELEVAACEACAVIEARLGDSSVDH